MTKSKVIVNVIFTYCKVQGPSWETNSNYQQFKKFPAFYGNRSFIATFTIAHLLSLSWARSIQSMLQSHFLMIHFNIMLPSKPVFSKRSLSLTFAHKNVYAPLLTPYVLHLILFDMIIRILFIEEYRSISFSLCIFSTPLNFVLLRPKYSPQKAILKLRQSTFLLQMWTTNFHTNTKQQTQLLLRMFWLRLFVG